MREFDYTAVPESLLTAETMNLLSAVHEARGRQSSNLSVRRDVLTALAEVARAQSTEASNRIEGVCTTDQRLRAIMANKTDLRSRDEEEIAGYRDVLRVIHESYEHISVTPGVILQLHRDMFRHTALAIGGRLKDSDNEIRGIREDGTQYVRFRPVPAVATSRTMEELCAALRRGLEAGVCDPILVDLMFVFDFTCIHPFNDGNGRMSRVLTLLLLYRSGYLVGRYISIEKEIERTKDAYYDALEASTAGWHDGSNDYGPFVRYMLGVVLAAYRDLEERVSAVREAGLSKSERVETILRASVGKMTKRQIAQMCPDISETTIERALKDLLDGMNIEKVGGGRGTGYIWIGEG